MKHFIELVHGNGTIKGRCMDRESSLDGEEGRGKGGRERREGGEREREGERILSQLYKRFSLSKLGSNMTLMRT